MLKNLDPAASSPACGLGQANAQLSTGPRTAEGKTRSAGNARTHCPTSREVVIQAGEQPDFDQLLDDLTDELAPEGTLETLTFNNLIHAAWNQRRCRLLEAELAARRYRSIAC